MSVVKHDGRARSFRDSGDTGMGCTSQEAETSRSKKLAQSLTRQTFSVPSQCWGLWKHQTRSRSFRKLDTPMRRSCESWSTSQGFRVAGGILTDPERTKSAVAVTASDCAWLAKRVSKPAVPVLIRGGPSRVRPLSKPPLCGSTTARHQVAAQQGACAAYRAGPASGSSPIYA
jgi:hypothetical protein